MSIFNLCCGNAYIIPFNITIITIYGCGNIINQKSNPKYGSYVMESFEFESGRVLENVNVEYVTSGIPQYDENGNITNAVIYCPTLNGDHAILPNYHRAIKDSNFEKDEYYFIRIFSLGTPESCSPSNTGLRYNFPSYTFKDRINFKRQFLAEKFKINKVLGLLGEGIGGSEVFTWACEYPDEMEFIILLNSCYKTHGYSYAISKYIENIIDSSEDYYSDSYSPSLSRLFVNLLKLLFMCYFPNKTFKRLNNDEIDVLMDDYVDDGLFMDIYDFKLRNDCILGCDLEDKLSNIKAKSLILGTEGVLFCTPEIDVIPLENKINNVKVGVFENNHENYYDEADNIELLNEIISFLNQFKK